MPLQRPEAPFDLDSVHFATTDRDAVARALDADSVRDGLTRVAPESLIPFGRWWHGDEDPGIRRFLVSPPGRTWTTVLTSATDWEHEWVPRIAEALGCRAAHLMLHDEDVCTVHLFDGARLVGSYVSSPEHFDEPPRAPGDLGLDVAAVLRFLPRRLTAAELVKALTPRGRIDVDGRRALEAMTDLLDLGPRGLESYRLALAPDCLTPSPQHADDLHLAYRVVSDEEREETEAEESAEASEEGVEDPGGGGVVLPFRTRPSR
jgi:hypothetical protein